MSSPSTNNGKHSSDGRIPPHDLKIEESLLAVAILHDDAFAEIVSRGVRIEDFYEGKHQRIFEAALHVRGEGKPVDAYLVGAQLMKTGRAAQVGGLEELYRIVKEAPVKMSVRAYIDELVEKSQVRQLIIVCQRYAATGYIDYGDAGEFIASLQGSVERLGGRSQKFVFETAREIMNEDRDAVGDDFLIPQLAIGPGRTGIMGGDSYTGKSVVAADIAIGVNTGADVFGIFRVAERGDVLWLNYDQAPKLARRRLRRIARAKRVVIGERHRFEIAHFPNFYIDDDDAIEALVRMTRGFKLCVIDALIGSVARTREQDEQIGRVLLRLMQVSERTGVAFLVVHHTIKPQAEWTNAKGKSRKAGPKRAVSASLRGNRAIFGSADTVIMLESTGKRKPVRVIHEKAPTDGQTLDDFYLQFDDVPKPVNALLDDDETKADPRWGLRVVHLEPEQVETVEKPASIEEGDLAARASFEKLIDRVLETLNAYPASSNNMVKKLLKGANHDAVDRALFELEKRKRATFVPGPRKAKLWSATCSAT